MKIEPKIPPRAFLVGNAVKFEIRDCGTVELEPDEQITFRTESGAEYDVARKDWGFYATPSLNARLQQFGLRSVLIRNRTTNRYFVLMVERGREASFNAYCDQEGLSVVSWLDSTEALDELAARMEAKP